MAQSSSKRRSPAAQKTGRAASVASGAKAAPSAVTKTLRILECVAANAKPIGVRELARELGFGKSTSSRILLALASEGYVEFDPDTSGYRLGNKLLHLTSRHYQCMRIHEIARPHMLAARGQTGETVFLGVRDGWNVVVLDRVDSPQPLRMVTELGSTEPAYCTGLGKVLLAFTLDLDKQNVFKGLRLHAYTRNTITDIPHLRQKLLQVREEGHAFDDGEMFEEVRCVACPVHDHHGRVIAAVSVSGPSFRMGHDRLESTMAAVKRMAKSISADLGNVEALERPAATALKRAG